MAQKPMDSFCINMSVIEKKYSLLARNRFTWEGLPPSLKQEYIENALYKHGQCFFYYDTDLKEYICLPCTPTGMQNVYGEFLGVQVFGFNHNKILPMSEGVWIKNNIDCYPSKLIVDFYLDKIIKSDQLELINIEQQKVPYILTATKDNLLSVKNFMNKVHNGETEVIVDKLLAEDIGKDGVKAFTLNPPYLLDKVPQYRRKIEKELLTYLGINSANTEKRERLLMDEVNSNNEEIQSQIETDLFTRQLACEQIKEKFNLNITCEINKPEVKGGIEIYDNNRTEKTDSE